jgi:N-methylhydantoinase B
VLLDAPFELRRGDVYRHVLASGGGYGPPLEREPERVLEDVILGRVTPEAAREQYGVEIVAGDGAPRIDPVATKRLRDGTGAAA